MLATSSNTGHFRPSGVADTQLKGTPVAPPMTNTSAILLHRLNQCNAAWMHFLHLHTPPSHAAPALPEFRHRDQLDQLGAIRAWLRSSRLNPGRLSEVL
jgi:hypothetical protein